VRAAFLRSGRSARVLFEQQEQLEDRAGCVLEQMLVAYLQQGAYGPEALVERLHRRCLAEQVVAQVLQQYRVELAHRAAVW